MMTTPRPEPLDVATIIDERDAAIEWADRLAEAIAGYFSSDIGEHSNLNDPWRNALDLVPAAPREE
jgi:hypothetical protein